MHPKSKSEIYHKTRVHIYIMKGLNQSKKWFMSPIYNKPKVNFQTVTMETHPFCNESVRKGVSQNYSVRTGGVEFLSSVETLRPLRWSTSTWELRVPSRHQVLEHLIASWIKHYTPSENGHQCLQSAGYTNPLSLFLFE